MIDTFHISDGSVNRQVFYATGPNAFQTWNKPQNCKFVYFFLIGGGGGGGGGQSGGTGTARRGGGSGGSGGITKGMFPSSIIPDRLYIQVGSGGSAGLGGTTNSDGGTAGISYVMVTPDTGETAQNIILQSSLAAAGSGRSGLNGGALGAGATAWVFTNNIFYKFGLVDTYAGQAGVAGQTTSTANTITVSGIVSAGGAGAGTNGATALSGGTVFGGGSIPTMLGGPAGGSATSTTPGGGGSGGYMTFNPNTLGYSTEPMIFIGGAGGGSSDGGTGGTGGSGAYGCGGGGGGAGITNQGGNGGKGGDGLVIITWW